MQKKELLELIDIFEGISFFLSIVSVVNCIDTFGNIMSYVLDEHQHGPSCF